MLPIHHLKKNCIKVPVITIDFLVKQKCLTPPYLLKLDTHGYEIPILEHSKETLKNTNLIVIEAYNFKLTHNSLKFYEMCIYMEQHGFSCIDISEPLFRPKDKALWQIDLFFIPSTRPEFKDNNYL